MNTGDDTDTREEGPRDDMDTATPTAADAMDTSTGDDLLAELRAADPADAPEIAERISAELSEVLDPAAEPDRWEP